MSNQQSPLPPIDDDFVDFEADDLPHDMRDKPIMSDANLAIVGSALALFVATAALGLSIMSLCRTFPH